MSLQPHQHTAACVDHSSNGTPGIRHSADATGFAALEGLLAKQHLELKTFFALHSGLCVSSPGDGRTTASAQYQGWSGHMSVTSSIDKRAGSASTASWQGSAHKSPWAALRESWTLSGFVGDDDVRCDVKHSMQKVFTRKAIRSPRTSLMRSEIPSFELEGGGGRRCTSLHPQGKLRFSWDILSFFIIVLDLVMLPVVIGFNLDDGAFLKAMGWLAAIFWTLDMPLSFITGYKQGAWVELSPCKTAGKYLKTWFFLDLVLLAAEWSWRVATLPDAVDAVRGSRILRGLRAGRGVRIVRMIRLFKVLEWWQETTASVQALLIASLAELLVALILAVHLLACGWAFLGSFGSTGCADQSVDFKTSLREGYETECGWIFREGFDGVPLGFRYAESIRWSVSQISGETDSKARPEAEVAFVTLVAFFALLFMSMFVSRMTTKMVQIMNFMAQESRHLRLLRSYADQNHLSWRTTMVVKAHIQDQLRKQYDADSEAKLISCLPQQLRMELLYEVRVKHLRKHKFFEVLCHEFSEEARTLTNSAIELLVAGQLELIFDKGVLLHGMLFVQSGSLVYSRNANLKSECYQVRERTTSVAARLVQAASNMTSRSKDSPKEEREIGCSHLEPGSYACEQCLWTKKWKSRGEMIATAHSNLLRLKALEFEDIITNHPEMKLWCSYYAHSFVAYMHELEHMDEASDIAIMDCARVADDVVCRQSGTFRPLNEVNLSWPSENSNGDFGDITDNAAGVVPGPPENGDISDASQENALTRDCNYDHADQGDFDGLFDASRCKASL
eukprot:TRINITY_DN13973_c0_g1_i1.p1 TRINITY_DN13973_c0_g1~~TRINITY_DN13973_c0_g1_i1.p1  ORF type:complete len:805 (+),score=102.57 TRINITY_DN13973_c0_g1_i1:46-2415(+)